MRFLLRLWKAAVSEAMVTMVMVTVAMASEVMARVWVRSLGGGAGNAPEPLCAWRPGQSFISEEAASPGSLSISSAQAKVLSKTSLQQRPQDGVDKEKLEINMVPGGPAQKEASLFLQVFSADGSQGPSGLRWGPPPCSPGP